MQQTIDVTFEVTVRVDVEVEGEDFNHLQEVDFDINLRHDHVKLLDASIKEIKLEI